MQAAFAELPVKLDEVMKDIDRLLGPSGPRAPKDAVDAAIYRLYRNDLTGARDHLNRVRMCINDVCQLLKEGRMPSERIDWFYYHYARIVDEPRGVVVGIERLVKDG